MSGIRCPHRPARNSRELQSRPSMVNVVSPPRIRSIQDRSASGLYWAAWWTSSRRASRYDHHPVAITHDQVTGRYRHPAALDRLSDPAMPTLVGPGCACSAGKDRQILFSKLIDIPEAPSMTTPRIPATSAATVSTSDPKPGHSSTGHPSGHRTMRSPSSVTLSSQRTRALTNAGQGGHP